MNAPILINAIAEDDMLPKIFNFLKGDIRKSLFFTVGLIAISICFGSIDQVAPLVTIFYLLCYGGVNISMRKGRFHRQAYSNYFINLEKVPD